MIDQQTLRSETPVDSPEPSDEQWRSEIHARVARYRNRRGRRLEGTYSMRFPFSAGEEQPDTSSQPRTPSAMPPETAVEVEAISAIGVLEAELAVEVAEEVSDVPMAAPEPQPETTFPAQVDVPTSALVEAPEVAIADTEPEDPAPPPELSLEPDSEPLSPPVPRPAAKRKVIAFPRQATTLEEPVYRLADPVVPEQPRILDVPEELEPYPTTPLLEGLQLPAAQQMAAPSPDHIDLPFQAVTLPRRFCAALLDCALVAVASAIFGGVAYKLLHRPQLSKPVLLIAASLPILFWAVYQYILTMYAGMTLGMQVAKIRLSTFKGGAPNWRYRRSRVISLYFSVASLMMGILWAMVDVDALCWHDRISHTYLTKRQ